MKHLKNTILVISLAILSTGCANHSTPEPDQPSPRQTITELFSPIEKEGAYSMTFKSNFPSVKPKSSIIASDASGKGPFIAYIACNEGGEMIVTIDSEFREKISCDESIHEIHEIQKIALTGGIKATIESDKESGSWQIQFLSTRAKL